MAFLTFVYLFCLRGIYLAYRGISNGNYTDVIVAIVFMCVGLNFYLINPISLIFIFIGIIVGVFFVTPWYLPLSVALAAASCVYMFINFPLLVEHISQRKQGR